MVPFFLLIIVALLVVFIAVLYSLRDVLRQVVEQNSAAKSSAEQTAKRAVQIAVGSQTEAHAVRQMVTPRTERYPCKKCNGTGQIEVTLPSPLVAEIHASLVDRFGKEVNAVENKSAGVSV